LFSYESRRETISICIYATDVIIGQAGDSVVTHLLGGDANLNPDEESVDCKEGEDGNVILGCNVAEKGDEQLYDEDDPMNALKGKSDVCAASEDEAGSSDVKMDSTDLPEAVAPEAEADASDAKLDQEKFRKAAAPQADGSIVAMDDTLINPYEPEGNYHTKTVVRKQRLICTLERSKTRHSATVFVNLTKTDVYEVAAVTYNGLDLPKDKWTYNPPRPNPDDAKQNRGRDYTMYKKGRVNWIYDYNLASSSLQLQQGGRGGGSQAVQAAEEDGDGVGAGGILLFLENPEEEDLEADPVRAAAEAAKQARADAEMAAKQARKDAEAFQGAFGLDMERGNDLDFDGDY
jgi:hypothetical protein